MAEGYFTTQDAQVLISDLVDNVWEAETPEQKTVFNKIFKVDEFGRAEYVNYQLAGLGKLTEREIMEDIDYDAYDFGTKQTITPVNFGRGFRVAEETIEDLADAGPYDGENAARLGAYADVTRRWKRSSYWTVEVECADKVTNATSTAAKYVGRDGLALFSASHVTLRNPPITQSNLTTGASVSAVNIMTGITALQTQYDDRGDFIDDSEGYILWHSPNDMFRVNEILATRNQVDSANNNVNPLRDVDITPVCWKYLGPTYTGWGLISKSSNPLRWMWRKKPAYAKSEDFDAVAVKYRVRMRGAYFHIDYRGAVGFMPS